MLGGEINGGDCIELIFSPQGSSPTRCAKAKDLWTFLDKQQRYSSSAVCVLLPSGPRSNSLKRSIAADGSCRKTCPIISKISTGLTSLENVIDKDRPPSSSPSQYRRSWHDQLVLFQRLGLEKIAILAVNDTGNESDDEESLREKKILRDDRASFADSLSMPNDEINYELKLFDQRVKRNEATKTIYDRQIYKMPEKYERYLNKN